MRIELIILLLLYFISSCRKDAPIVPPEPEEFPCETTTFTSHFPDTITPSEYLMAYPGSWWEYDDGNRIECVSYKAVPFYTESYDTNNCPVLHETYYTIPWLIDSLNYEYGILGNSKVKIGSSDQGANSIKIMGTFGESWEHNSDWVHDGYNNSTQIRRTYSCDSVFSTKTFNGVTYSDIIYIHNTTQVYHSHFAGGPITENGYYYSRFVGLVKHTCFSESWGWDYQRTLTDYFIAPY